ncbi:CYIR protein, partial [Plasmodium cynomolgi strain B]
YISYQDYGDVKKEFDKTINNNASQQRFKEIIDDMTNENYGVSLKNNMLSSLHNVLSNDHAFIIGLKPLYCSYINYWLNKEVQNTSNAAYAAYFPIFQEFSDRLCNKISGNLKDSCRSYIFVLGNDTVNKMNFLYKLYDVYNEIISHSNMNKTQTCYKLLPLAKNYHESIDKYYYNDKDLYNKLEDIKGLIDGIIGRTKYCTQSIFFTKPTNLVDLLKAEQARREAEVREKLAQEEAARRAEEEAARRVLEEEARQVKEEQYIEEQKLLQYNDPFSISRINHLQEMHQKNQDFHSIKYGGGSHKLGNTGLHETTRISFGHSDMSESSPGGSITHAIEGTKHPREIDNDQEDKDTTRSGTVFNSSDFQGYITEVLDSVDPIPVVGVSGGMGALYLLLKYTPVGSFFGGGRRQMRQIRRNVEGFPPGGFPNFYEYDGGFIGYAPMNIPYPAE